MALHKYDSFGHRFAFFMRGDRSTKTLTGFICTLIATGLIVFSFVMFYLVMQDTKLPAIETSQSVSDASPEIMIGDDIFMFITLVNYRTIVPRSFLPVFNRIEVVMSYEEIRNDPFPTLNDNTKVTKQKGFSMVPCNTTESFARNRKNFTPLQLTALDICGWCLPDNTKDNPLIVSSSRGRIISDRKMTINIYPCPLPSGCLSYEYKKDLLFFLGFIENGFNGLDFEQPIVKMRNMNTRFQVYEGMHKRFSVHLQKFQAITDTGKFNENLAEHQGYSVDPESVADFSLHSGLATDPLLSINIEASNKVIVYKRSYGKFVSFISSLGGIIQITMSLVAILYSVYNWYIHKRNLILFGIMDLMPNDEKSASDNKIGPKDQNLSKNLVAPEKRIAERKKSERVLRSASSMRKDTKITYSSFWKYLILPNSSSKLNYTGYSASTLDEFRRLKYWTECEKILEFSIDINNVLPLLNELYILRQIFLKDYHLRLAPRIGCIFLREAKLLRHIKRPSSEDVYLTVQAWINKKQQNGEQDIKSMLMETQIKVAKELLASYKAYREKEHNDFIIVSGIKNLMAESEYFKTIAQPAIKDDQSHPKKRLIMNVPESIKDSESEHSDQQNPQLFKVIVNSVPIVNSTLIKKLPASGLNLNHSINRHPQTLPQNKPGRRCPENSNPKERISSSRGLKVRPPNIHVRRRRQSAIAIKDHQPLNFNLQPHPSSPHL